MWHSMVESDIVRNSYSYSKLEVLNHPFKPDPLWIQKLNTYSSDFQVAGESKAWDYLQSFVEARGANYMRHISKPNESRDSCSRLSPYLAWGNITIQEAYQYVKYSPSYSRNKKPFSAFLTRLKWHCHFIQKFEVECDYETRCINRGYETLAFTNNEALIRAWKEGKTGFY